MSVALPGIAAACEKRVPMSVDCAIRLQECEWRLNAQMSPSAAFDASRPPSTIMRPSAVTEAVWSYRPGGNSPDCGVTNDHVLLAKSNAHTSLNVYAERSPPYTYMVPLYTTDECAKRGGGDGPLVSSLYQERPDVIDTGTSSAMEVAFDCPTPGSTSTTEISSQKAWLRFNPGIRMSSTAKPALSKTRSRAFSPGTLFTSWLSIVTVVRPLVDVTSNRCHPAYRSMVDSQGLATQNLVPWERVYVPTAVEMASKGPAASGFRM
mmetsp:Transcript_48661/g.93097  ORF Transcript_48661/g.93097 Transcript_48661/m.93097 type:complete len:264 (-) Transcript_48661:448-1239(-)